MSLNRLHERLAEYGFTREEAETYVFLAAMGPASAGTVAKRFNYNRMKSYRLLNNLEETGLVHSIVGRPVRYVVVPIEEIVDNRIDAGGADAPQVNGNPVRTLEVHSLLHSFA